MHIRYTDSDNDPQRSLLLKNLVEFNDSQGQLEKWKPMSFYAEDDNGNLLGGIHGQFEWDYLMIKYLWVSGRGTGLGTVLLNKAEELAREENKKGVCLDTFGFQAPAFYEKNGYTVFGEIPNAAGLFSRYYFRKDF